MQPDEETRYGGHTQRGATMSDYAQAINQHYGHAELSAKILTALREAGKDIATLTRRADLAPFDEHHRSRREATQSGAPRRGCAKACMCSMSAVALGTGAHPRRRVWLPGHWPRSHRGMLRTAEMLTACVGLREASDLRQGNALDMPFAAATFDVVWTQDV